ncbi:MAG: 4-hydroxy-2-oxo-heptane-1,7-dioate aldolase [Rhizobium sp. 63-7]|nr:MAG: 4-hydroxy-2-oxo-heptane-1,7-dioate aldolase [Rhizobium sp. 63-7]
MQAPRNSFKRRLLAGETQNGLWLTLGSPISSEALSLVGFDWLLFDTEHSPVDLAAVQPLLQAAAIGTAQAVVRPAWNDKVLIKRVLDMGAQTLLVPFVESPEEATAAVAATRYPPRGLRGVAGATRASRFGLTSDYFTVADEEVAVLVQIETVGALARLEEIAAVPGVDGIFIGPSDLSASMGFLGRSGAAEVQAVLEEAAARIRAAGKAPGILATNAADALRYRGWGYRFIAGAVDLGLLLAGARAVLTEMKGSALQHA